MSSINPDDPKKEYTGVWIPKEVMENSNLSATDKIVYAEIACFDECYASNEWLAKRIGRSASTASKCVSRLISLGIVEPCGFDGRFRKVRVVKNCKPSKKLRGSLVKNGESASPKTASRDNSIDKSKSLMDTKVSIGESPVTDVVRSQRSLDIDEAFVIWEEVMGYPLAANKTDRHAIHSILSRKEMDLEKLRMLVLLVKKSQTDRYKRFSITNFTDLMYKTNDLVAWAHEKAAQQKQESRVVEV